jgi:hypothetical protein
MYLVIIIYSFYMLFQAERNRYIFWQVKYYCRPLSLSYKDFVHFFEFFHGWILYNGILQATMHDSEDRVLCQYLHISFPPEDDFTHRETIVLIIRHTCSLHLSYPCCIGSNSELTPGIITQASHT